MESILGRTILGYRVVEKIGSGGFGDVYRVERSNIVGNTTRALKIITIPSKNEYIEVLNSMGGDREKTNSYFRKELNRVINEIRVFSLISEKDNHNIVSYYESDVEQVGEFRYNIYILMEMLMPLSKWVQNTNITVEDVLKIGIDISSGLSVCHKNNIIHRDIKLSNIFVTKDGVFKLGDFGVSKKINDTTGAKTIKGTPNYIAPEVYIGQGQYNSSVDNYSLGILLYYLFNKKRFPYYPDFPSEYTTEDEDKAFYKRMKYEKLSNPVCAPKEIAAIIRKAISSPEERYKRADDFLNDLLEAKNKLSKEELSRKIGFDSINFKDEVISEKEAELVENLYGRNDDSISFQQYGITLEDDSIIKENHNAANHMVKEVKEEQEGSVGIVNSYVGETSGTKTINNESENPVKQEENKTDKKYRIPIIVIIILANILIILLVAYGLTDRIFNMAMENSTQFNTTVPENTMLETTAVPETTTVIPTTVSETTKKKKKKKTGKNTVTTVPAVNNNSSWSTGGSYGSSSTGNTGSSSGNSSSKNTGSKSSSGSENKSSKTKKNDDDFDFKNVVE